MDTFCAGALLAKLQVRDYAGKVRSNLASSGIRARLWCIGCFFSHVPLRWSRRRQVICRCPGRHDQIVLTALTGAWKFAGATARPLIWRDFMPFTIHWTPVGDGRYKSGMMPFFRLASAVYWYGEVSVPGDAVPSPYITFPPLTTATFTKRWSVDRNHHQCLIVVLNRGRESCRWLSLPEFYEHLGLGAAGTTAMVFKVFSLHQLSITTFVSKLNAQFLLSFNLLTTFSFSTAIPEFRTPLFMKRFKCCHYKPARCSPVQWVLQIKPMTPSLWLCPLVFCPAWCHAPGHTTAKWNPSFSSFRWLILDLLADDQISVLPEHALCGMSSVALEAECTADITYMQNFHVPGSLPWNNLGLTI